MSTINLMLGEYWERFIKHQIDTGCYRSADELIKDALKLLERQEIKLNDLRSALIAGEKSGPSGPLDMDQIKKKARRALL